MDVASRQKARSARVGHFSHYRGGRVVSRCRVAGNDTSDERIGYEKASAVKFGKTDEVTGDARHEFVGLDGIPVRDYAREDVLQS